MNKAKLTELCQSVGIAVGKKDTEVTLQEKIDAHKVGIKFKEDDWHSTNNPDEIQEAINFSTECILLEMFDDAVKYYQFALMQQTTDEQKKQLREVMPILTPYFPVYKTEVKDQSAAGSIEDEKKDEINKSEETENNNADDNSENKLDEPGTIVNPKTSSKAKQEIEDMLRARGKDNPLTIDEIKFFIEGCAEMLAAYQKQQRAKGKNTGRFRIAERALRSMVKKQLR